MHQSILSSSTASHHNSDFSLFGRGWISICHVETMDSAWLLYCQESEDMTEGYVLPVSLTRRRDS